MLNVIGTIKCGMLQNAQIEYNRKSRIRSQNIKKIKYIKKTQYISNQ